MGQKDLRAPKYAATATLRGEIRMSEIRLRIEEGNNELLKQLMEEIKEDGSNR